RRLREGDAAQDREAIERLGVEERQRHGPVPDGGAQALERYAGRHEALDQPGLAEVARGAFTVIARRDDPELAVPRELVGSDAAPLRRFGQIVGVHRGHASGWARDRRAMAGAARRLPGDRRRVTGIHPTRAWLPARPRSWRR